MNYNNVKHEIMMEQYRYFIEQGRGENDHISFKQFLRMKEQEMDNKRDFEFIMRQMPLEKPSSNSRATSYGLFGGLSFEPASEVDRQTLNRWTKQESLTERWNRL